MTCVTCRRDTLSLVPNGSGLMEPLCDECRARPETFAEGTQNGKDTFAAALRNRDEAAQELQNALSRHAAAVDCLRVLVQHWRKEMRGGYSTPEMQWALREAESLIKERG